MNKIAKISAVIAVVCALAGCGSNNNNENVNVSTIYSGISPMADGNLVEMNDNYILNYYGINTADLQEYVFAQSDDPKSAETIIIFKCDDKEKRNTYEEAVSNALEQKEQELSNYDLPDEAKLVKDAKIKTSGNLVYVVISDNADSMNKIIKDSI
ncbi:MAG: DUF4358 domain-containing protein [Clostridia bacterium]|nr:DUF4358 domain-containing protein [Clostridia bacterium]